MTAIYQNVLNCQNTVTRLCTNVNVRYMDYVICSVVTELYVLCTLKITNPGIIHLGILINACPHLLTNQLLCFAGLIRGTGYCDNSVHVVIIHIG